MRRATLLSAMMTLLASAALASDARTSATAGSNRYDRNGAASATAHYEGDLGYARTDSQSGAVNRSRGIAWGVDEDGLSLSVSNAVAPRNGPAVATSFNMSIGTDGRVSRSRALSIADGPIERSATAGGGTSTNRFGSASTAHASGRTDPFGRVKTQTFAQSNPTHRPVTVRYAPARPVTDHYVTGRSVSTERHVVRRFTTVRHVRR